MQRICVRMSPDRQQDIVIAWSSRQRCAARLASP